LSCWAHAQSKFKYKQICARIQDSQKRKTTDNETTNKQKKHKKLKQERDDARELGLQENNNDLLDFDLQTVTELNLASLGLLPGNLDNEAPDNLDNEAEEGWI